MPDKIGRGARLRFSSSPYFILLTPIPLDTLSNNVRFRKSYSTMAIFADLSISLILKLALIVPIGYVFIGAIYRRYFHSLSKYPGPFLASITRWWMVSEIFSGKHEQHIRALHKKYGTIVRISPN